MQIDDDFMRNAQERGTEGETQFFAIKLVVEMMMAGRLLLFCRLLKGPAEKWSSRNLNEPHSIQLTVRFLAPKLAQFANATPRVVHCWERASSSSCLSS